MPGISSSTSGASAGLRHRRRHLQLIRAVPAGTISVERPARCAADPAHDKPPIPFLGVAAQLMHARARRIWPNRNLASVTTSVRVTVTAPAVTVTILQQV